MDPVTIPEVYRSGIRRRWICIFSLLILLVLASFIAITLGSANIPMPEAGEVLLHVLTGRPAPQNISESTAVIIANIRLPRILLAILTGISLAMAGTVMQALLRNPLVSPFTLGLSSAASFGAALAIVFLPSFPILIAKEFQNSAVAFMAFIFGILSMILIYGIARSRGTTQATLILSGVVIGYIFQAGVMILKFFTNNDKLREITVWLMGGMWGANWSAILIVLPVTLLCFIFLERNAWELNALMAGEDIAKNLGIRIGWLRLSGLLISTLAASCCLAFTGIIGFVGLMAPHMSRMLIGGDNRYLIPCSALMGACILLVSDTVARTIMAPIEIPVGVIMYIIGGGFFLLLILKGKRHIY